MGEFGRARLRPSRLRLTARPELCLRLAPSPALRRWGRVAGQLRAGREAQRHLWAGLDAAVVGRFLAGEGEPGERHRVEAALAARPELARLVGLVRSALGAVPEGPESP